MRHLIAIATVALLAGCNGPAPTRAEPLPAVPDATVTTSGMAATGATAPSYAATPSPVTAPAGALGSSRPPTATTTTTPQAAAPSNPELDFNIDEEDAEELDRLLADLDQLMADLESSYDQEEGESINE